MVALKQLQLVEHLVNSGDFRRAEKACLKFCRDNPKNAKGAYLLSVIYINNKDYEEAVRLTELQLQERPEAPELLYNYASALNGLGRQEDAIDVFYRLVRAGAGKPEVLFQIGQILYKQSKYHDSSRYLSKALELRPDYIDAQIYLSASLQQLGLYQLAEQGWHRVLKIQPGLDDAYLNLALIAQHTGNDDASIEFYGRLIKVNPLHAEGHFGLGNSLIKLGRHEEAMDAFDKAKQLGYDRSRIFAAQAKLYQVESKYDVAYTLVDEALKAGYMSPDLATAFADICTRYNDTERAIELLNTVSEGSDLNVFEKADIHYSLARLMDGLGDIEGAFNNARIANECLPYRYTPSDCDSQLENIRGLKANDLQSADVSTVSQDDRPVFIVGMPRSGTTLVEQIITSHPLIHGGGELNYIYNTVSWLAKKSGERRFYADWIASIDPGDASIAASQYVDNLSRLNQDAVRITDKMPHNFVYLGLIQLLFPGSRVIHCTRDPMDTGLSVYFHKFNSSHAYARKLAWIGHQYNYYRHVMRHWLSIIKLPVYEISYEDLVTDTEEQVHALIEFCDVPWHDNCLEFHKQKRNINTPSVEQVRRPIYTSSVGKWRKYEKFLSELADALRKF